MTRPCPRCGRANAAHKAACLYCGAALPDPAPPPLAVTRELPADLDGLVAEALAGRGIGRLKSALQAVASSPAPTPDPLDAITITPVALDEGPSPEPEPEPTDPGDPLGAAFERAAAALEELRRVDPSGAQARRASDDLIAAAAAIGRLLPEPAAAPAPVPAPPSVALPPVRFAYALVIPGLNNPDGAPELAAALGVDVVTARQLAGSPHVRVASRAAAPDSLRAAAGRLAELGMRAVVLSRDALLQLPHPTLVVSARSGEPLRGLAGGPFWEGDPEQILASHGDPLPEPTPVLAVLGEIVLVRARAAAERNRLLRARTSTDPKRLDEQRLGVVDLWAEGLHLRLVEGLTRVDTPEGRPPFRTFCEGLAARFPGIRVEPRRICRPDERAMAGQPGETVAQTGWPTFDEHTRMAWLHFQGS